MTTVVMFVSFLPVHTHTLAVPSPRQKLNGSSGESDESPQFSGKTKVHKLSEHFNKRLSLQRSVNPPSY